MIDKEKIKNAVELIIEALGEDPKREGLKETPKRVSDMYCEIFSGINDDPKKHLKIFCEDNKQHEHVIVRDIPINSICEHHLLPFVGVAHVAYVPKNGNIIGLSKFARIVDCFAKRPQVQERLTNQIVDFMFDNLNPIGASVIIEAEHLCMTMRGVKAKGSKTITYAVRGEMGSDIICLLMGEK